MKILFLILGFFSLPHLHGQKLVKKTWIGQKTTSIQIDSQYCYDVKLQTMDSNEVRVTASIEGEYSKDLVVTIEENGAMLLIGSGFQPNFLNPNDKLSAHKVVSIALDISLPQHKNVLIYGSSSSVAAKGIFESLEVRLSDGRCLIDNVIGNTEVTTRKGDIILITASGNITAKSTYGKVEQQHIPQGNNLYVLNTIEGTIHLKKTK